MIKVQPLVSFDTDRSVQVDAGYALMVNGEAYSPERALAFADEIAAAVHAEDHRRVLEGPPVYQPERCLDNVAGTVPSWAGEDQISPCRCVRPKGHAGACACAHEEPADAVPRSNERGSGHV